MAPDEVIIEVESYDEAAAVMTAAQIVVGYMRGHHSIVTAVELWARLVAAATPTDRLREVVAYTRAADSD